MINYCGRDYRLLPVEWLHNIWRPDSFFKNAKQVIFIIMMVMMVMMTMIKNAMVSSSMLSYDHIEFFLMFFSGFIVQVTISRLYFSGYIFRLYFPDYIFEVTFLRLYFRSYIFQLIFSGLYFLGYISQV